MTVMFYKYKMTGAGAQHGGVLVKASPSTSDIRRPFMVQLASNSISSVSSEVLLGLNLT